MKRILLVVSFISSLGLMGMARLCLAQEATVPVPGCGNNVIEPGEECDGGFGCSTDCKLATMNVKDPAPVKYKAIPLSVEPSAVNYPAQPQPIFPTDTGCGNNVVEGDLGETCDDGNLTDGDGCDHLCHIELPPAVKMDPPAAGSGEKTPAVVSNPEVPPAAEGNSAVTANGAATPEQQAVIEGSAGCSMVQDSSVACNEVGFLFFGAMLSWVGYRRKK